MLKRVAPLCIAAIMTIGMLSGCGGSTSSDTTQTPAAQTEAAETETTKTEATETETMTAEAATAEDGPLTPYDEEVTITAVLAYRDPEKDTIPKDVTPETNAYVKLFKEQLNINLEFLWIVNSDQYEAKMGATIASGDLPDIMQVTGAVTQLSEQLRYAELRDQGAFAEISGLYDQYASPVTHAFFDKGAEYVRNNEGGKMYALVTGGSKGNYVGGSEIFYRKDWLDQLNLEVPVTLADMENVMAAFQKADLGGTGGAVLPASSNDIWGLSGNGFIDFTPIFEAYGAYKDVWLYNSDGEVYAPFMSDEGRAAITKINEWYQKGYINKDFASLNAWDASNPVVEDIIAGKYGIVTGCWWVPAWPLNLNMNAEPGAEWVGTTVPQVVDGENTFVVFNAGGDIGSINAISASCKNPEAVIKMMNLFLEAQLCKDNPSVAGTEKEEWGKEENGYVSIWVPFWAYYGDTLIENYTMMNKLISEGRTELNEDEQVFNTEFYGLLDKYKLYLSEPENGEAWGQYYSRIANDGGLGLMYRQHENNETKANLYNVGLTYDARVNYDSSMISVMEENLLKMIMGETPLSDWDNYVAQWESVGGEALRQEVTEKISQ